MTHPVFELEATAGTSRAHFDQCLLGAPSRKQTTLMGTIDNLNEFDDSYQPGHRDHGVVLRGKDEQSHFRTTSAARYASDICKLLAELHLRTMLQHRGEEVRRRRRAGDGSFASHARHGGPGGRRDDQDPQAT